MTAIIEKVSGQSYADFIEKNIFAPLGMKHSFYDSTERVALVAAIAKRVKETVRRCDYLSQGE